MRKKLASNLHVETTFKTYIFSYWYKVQFKNFVKIFEMLNYCAWFNSNNLFLNKKMFLNNIYKFWVTASHRQNKNKNEFTNIYFHIRNLFLGLWSRDSNPYTRLFLLIAILSIFRLEWSHSCHQHQKSSPTLRQQHSQHGLIGSGSSLSKVQCSI